MKNEFKMKAILLMITLITLSCKSKEATFTQSENTSAEVLTSNEDSKTIEDQKEKETFFYDSKGKRYNVVFKTSTDWKKELTDMEFYVLREEGTERAFTGDLWDNKKVGTYTCSGCDTPLFSSDTKYKSGTGWPSFYEPIDNELIHEDTDYNLGYARTEVECRRCGGHLGHVFNDCPKPTGLRYCINSVSLDFKEAN